MLYRAASDAAEDGGAGEWEERIRLVEAVITEHAPAIIGFQEVQPDQLEQLHDCLSAYTAADGPVNGVSRMPFWTKWFAPPLALGAVGLWASSTDKKGRIAGGVLGVIAAALPAMTLTLKKAKGSALYGGGHCPIFYRRDQFRAIESGTFWISQRPDQPNSILYGTWLPRIVNWVRLEHLETRKQLTVFNAHFDWWALARARSGRIAAGRMNEQWDGSPQIILGDFNAPQNSATYANLMEYSRTESTPCLQDSWQQAATQTGPDETYHGGEGEGSFPGRVDHILFRPQATVPRAVTITTHEGPVYPSDHFPLLAEIHFSS